MNTKSLQFKKAMRAALFVLLLCVAGMTKANPVDMRTAREVGYKFINANVTPMRGINDLQLVTTYNISRGDAAFYVFNTPNGFVIVSADDCATPILGYSDEGQFDLENIPVQLQDWLQDYVEQIQYGIENHLEADDKTAQRWEKVKATCHMTNDRSNRSADSWIYTKWGQECYYNSHCPFDPNGPCTHCVTGCVATAMAQIMKFWEYPSSGVGSHSYTPPGYPQQSANFGLVTYNWQNMPVSLNGSSSLGQVDAVALLMHHCGVSVEMEYGPVASGDGPIIETEALVDYFKYSPEWSHAWRTYTNFNFESRLKDCLDLGRPIRYGAQYIKNHVTVGHAFVCDDYTIDDDITYYHFNFGWSGNGDAYYPLDAIPTLDYESGAAQYFHSSLQHAYFNIHPKYRPSGDLWVTAYQIDVNATLGGTTWGGGSIYQHGTTVSLKARPNEGHVFCGWEEDGVIVSTDTILSFTANYNRTLKAVFKIPVNVSVSSTGGGTVEGGGLYLYDESCTVKAHPATGYSFQKWTENGIQVPNANVNYTFNVENERTLVAHFIQSSTPPQPPQTYTVTVEANPPIGGTVTGGNTYQQGASCTVTATPAAGYSFQKWTDQYGTELTNEPIYTFSVTTTCHLVAHFQQSQSSSNIVFVDHNVRDLCIEAGWDTNGDGALSYAEAAAVTDLGSVFEEQWSITSFDELQFFVGLTSIGNYAFGYCVYMTSITIPNTVTSIGDDAFEMCGLNSITVLAENPPVLGSNTFHGVPHGIPVYVPCGSFESYRAINWGGFNNFFGTCEKQITVSANPSNGGLVTGDGAFLKGQSCTVTATPNSGFFFAKWTENDALVSTNSSYTFTVFNNRNLVANFIEYSNTCPIYFYLHDSYGDGWNGNCLVVDWEQGIDTLTLENGSEGLALAGLVSSGSTISLSWISDAFTEECSFDIKYENGIILYHGSNLHANFHHAQIINCEESYVSEDNIVFADPNVRDLCIEAGWDTNGDSELSYAEAAAVTDLGTVFSQKNNITSFDELQYFIGLTSIDNLAFYNCTSLTSIVIPCVVTSIGNHAFHRCSGLEQIVVDPRNPFYDSRENCNAIIQTRISELVLGCKNTVIPNYSVLSIGDYAFSYCSGLTSIVIPTFMDNIGDCAFIGCSGLEQIIVNTDNTVYDSRDNCNAIIKTSTNELVAGCKNTVIPNSVTSIGSSAFYHCIGLTSIEIPNSVNSIGSSAFNYCIDLTSIEIPNSVTSIGSSAFNYCIDLTSIEIPNSVTSIGIGAFMNCAGLTSIEIPNSVTSIVSSTFQGCSGLTSVEISNSVTTIGGYAFKDCSGLNSMTVLADNPPTMSSVTFKNVNKEIPVYVPCGALEAYQNATGWSEFTNYIEMCSSIITATANPSESGTISGTGTYDFGTTVTLSATAKDGYVFANWTENGEVVSTESAYIFTVTGDRTLVANFEPVQLTNHWTPVAFGVYPSAAIIQGVIQINGVEQFTDQLELGAFCGEECRGSQRASYFPPTGRYIVQLMVFGENNDVISFRLYDHQQQQELPLTPPANVVFSVNMYGSLSAPYVLNFTSSVIQTQTLSKGWNWYSTYIEQEGIDGLGQLENSISVPKAIIQSQNSGYVKSILRNGTVLWGGALSSINNEEMYKIGTKYICTATMEGVATNPAEHPITINKGWNWIGFPCDHSVSVNEALSGFTPRNGDVIKGINSYTTYYSDNGYNMWYGTLNTLEPGQGYMYGTKNNTPKILVFQTGNRGEATLANITPANNYYQPTDDYADNMTIVAVVELDGEELRSEAYELAAFVGDECRGSVKLMYVESLNRYVAFLTVFGDEAEDMHFVLTDGATSDLSADYMTYATDGIVGTLDEPVVLRFGATDVNENALANVRIYPNPSNGVFNVEGVGIRKVEVTNAYGQVILSEEVKNDNLQINLSGNAAGAYLLRVVTDRGVATKKLVKE